MKLFGANWKTALFGFITIASAFIVQNPDLISSIIGESLSKRIFSIASLISGFIAFYYAKDKNVVGGTTQQTVSGAVADKGSQTLVDRTVVASIKSGDTTVTSEQKAAVKDVMHEN